MLSAPDAIGQALERYLEEKEGVQEALPLTVGTGSGGAQTQASASSSGLSLVRASSVRARSVVRATSPISRDA